MQETGTLKKFKANWVNISFFVPVHLVGIVAWPLYVALGGGIQWQEWAVFFFMFFLGALGVNVGYHRGLSHLSFKMSPFFRLITIIAGSSTAEGSALRWCSDHRRHHRFQDTGEDPYNIRQGFWWAHMGWILGSQSSQDFSNCPDLVRDPLLRNQDRYYVVWMVLTTFLLPLALGFALDRPLATLLLAGFTRLFIFNQCTNFINSYAHYFGRRSYSTEITARDSLIGAILSQGEGWHNFHHRFPWDYRNGHRFYHYDPSKWIIYGAQAFGWTYSLKKTPVHEIFRARIQTQKAKIEVANPTLDRISEALEAALAKWQVYHLEWQKMRKEFTDKRDQRMQELRSKLHEARREFLDTYRLWQESLKTRTEAYAT